MKTLTMKTDAKCARNASKECRHMDMEACNVYVLSRLKCNVSYTTIAILVLGASWVVAVTQAFCVIPILMISV